MLCVNKSSNSLYLTASKCKLTIVYKH